MFAHGCIRCGFQGCRDFSCPICFPQRHKHKKMMLRSRVFGSYIPLRESSKQLPEFIIKELKELKQDINNKRTEWTNKINKLLTNK